MTMLALLWAIAAPFLVGTFAARALGFDPRRDRLAFTAWAWLLGCLGIGLVAQLAVEVGLPPSWWYPLPFALCAILFPFVRGPVADIVPSPIGRGYVAFVAAGILLVLWTVAAGMDVPCIQGDEGNIWSLEAKSLLVDFPDRFARAQIYNLHPDYPKLDPLLQSWVYALTGTDEFVQFENRWLVQGCDLALFVAVAAALRHRLAPWASAGLCSLVLLEPEFLQLCRTAYADGMVALGLVVALDAWLRWRAGAHRGHAWLAGLGLAFALWSKNEAMLYAASLGGAALLVRLWVRPMRGGFSVRNLLALAPAGAIVVYTALWNRRFGLRSDLLGANPTGKTMFGLMAEQWPERVPVLLSEAGGTMLSLGHSHAIFGALSLAVFLAPRVALGPRLALPVLALLAGWVGLHVVYVGSFLPLRFHLDTSYLRVLFQLVPPAVVLVGAVVADIVASPPGSRSE